MNLSKEQLRHMRQEGDISPQEYLRLMMPSSKEDAGVGEEAVQADSTQQAIDRLSAVVEQVGKSISETQQDPDMASLFQALGGIKEQLKELTDATVLSAQTSNKRWVFTPKYSSGGRIEKLTVE